MKNKKAKYTDGPDLKYGKVVNDDFLPSPEQLKNAGTREFQTVEVNPGVFEEINVRFTPPKKSVTVRYDEDIIEFFKHMGPGYQTKMNDVLRAYVEYVKEHETA